MNCLKSENRKITLTQVVRVIFYIGVAAAGTEQIPKTFILKEVFSSENKVWC